MAERPVSMVTAGKTARLSKDDRSLPPEPVHRGTDSGRSTPPRNLVGRDRGGGGDVQRPQPTLERDGGDDVAALPDEPRKPRTLRSQHEHDRIGGERELGDRRVAPTVEPDDPQPGRL